MNVYSTIVFWTSKLKSQDSSYTVTTADGTAGGERIRDYESFADVPVPGAVVSTPRLELQVFFDTNRIALGKGEENAINDFIEQLKSNVNVRRILVVGYTDTDGTAEYNASISRRRAKTVEAAFEASFPRAEITSRAAGESHPVATNSTAEGRRFNRRVEVILNGG